MSVTLNGLPSAELGVSPPSRVETAMPVAARLPSEPVPKAERKPTVRLGLETGL